MISVLALGERAARLAKKFDVGENYDVTCFDEHYESAGDMEAAEGLELPDDFNPVALQEEVLLVLHGEEPANGASLRILEQLQPKLSLKVLYLVPDLRYCTEKQAINHKIGFNILQEYARSGLLADFLIIDLVRVDEKCLGSVPLQQLEDKVYDYLYATIDTINFLLKVRKVIESRAVDDAGEPARISTLSMVDIKNNVEHVFFSLTKPRTKCYLIGANEEDLSDGILFRNMVYEHMDMKREEEKERGEFRVCQWDHKMQCFCIHKSSVVQNKVLTTQ